MQGTHLCILLYFEQQLGAPMEVSGLRPRITSNGFTTLNTNPLRRLEGMLSSGASGFVPSVEEIQAYKERPPILATISLVDGMVLTEELPVTPDLNSGKVVEICAQFLELVDERAAVGERHYPGLGLEVLDEGVVGAALDGAAQQRRDEQAGARK